MGVTVYEAIAPEPPPGFAKQIGLYAASLGDGAAALVAVAALGDKFTTCSPLSTAFPECTARRRCYFSAEEEPGPVGPVGAVLVAFATGLPFYPAPTLSDLHRSP